MPEVPSTKKLSAASTSSHKPTPQHKQHSPTMQTKPILPGISGWIAFLRDHFILRLLHCSLIKACHFNAYLFLQLCTSFRCLFVLSLTAVFLFVLAWRGRCSEGAVAPSSDGSSRLALVPKQDLSVQDCCCELSCLALALGGPLA